MRLGYLLEALNNPYGDHSAFDTHYGTPTEPIMLPIPVDECHSCKATALGEGRNVDDAMDALLKHSGYDGDENKALRERVIKAVNALPVVWASPNGQNARTGKDALPILAWFLGTWNGKEGTIQHDLEQVSDLVVAKNGMKSTRGKWLDELQRRYPTMDKFRAFIERERENPANKVEDDSVEGYDYPNPFYSDAKVDVYKASTISDAIKYSKGYTFCIGRRDGSNLFYGYRIAADAPESTVYFCWFKGPNGEKTHDNMCVIHVSSNGRYRMTNAGNTNGSPVVDKETVLKEYPALKGVLDKMYSEPLDDEEKVVSSVRPFTVIELNDTTKGYTRKQIAMLIGNACRFGDDYFEWVYETLDGGDLESGDSLIRKYLATGANRPTEEQEERLVRDGWGEYVEYNLKQYTKQVNEFQEDRLARQILDGKVTEVTRKGRKWYKAKGVALYLYKPLDKPVLLGEDADILFQGELWSDDMLNNFEVDQTIGAHSTFQFKKCTRLKAIDLSKYELDLNIRFDFCTNLRSIKFKTVSYAWINYCEALNDVSMLVTASCIIYNNRAIKNFESFRNLKALMLTLEGLSGLESLKGIEYYVDNVGYNNPHIHIMECSNLTDVSELGKLQGDKYITGFELQRCESISKEDFIRYVVPMQKNPDKLSYGEHISDEYLEKKFRSDNSRYPLQLDMTGEKPNYRYTGFEIDYIRPLKKPVEVEHCKLWKEACLNDLSGIYSCDTLDIKKLYGLTNLRPISKIKGIRRISISDCPNLLSLEGCPDVEELRIYNCNNLSDFEDFPESVEEFHYDGYRIPQLPTIGTKKIDVRFAHFNEGDMSGVYCENLELRYLRGKIRAFEPFKNFPSGVQKLVVDNNYVSFKGFTYNNVPKWIDFEYPSIDSLNELPLEDIFRVMDLKYPNGRNRLCMVTISTNEEMDEELQERYYEWAKKQHKKG